MVRVDKPQIAVNCRIALVPTCNIYRQSCAFTLCSECLQGEKLVSQRYACPTRFCKSVSHDNPELSHHTYVSLPSVEAPYFDFGVPQHVAVFGVLLRLLGVLPLAT